MLDRRSSMVIDAMRFPLIVLVIFAHVPSITTQNLEDSSWLYQFYLIVSNNISFVFARITISFFFFLSGYFFFYSIEPKNLFTKLRTRVKTVLIPYITWNLLAFVVATFKLYLFNKIGLSNEKDYLDTSLISIFWLGPADYPLWYLRDLLCMFFISPLIYLLLTYNPFITICIFATLYIFSIDTIIPGFGIIALFFYSIGGYLGMKKFDFVRWCDEYFIHLLLASTILLISLNILYDSTLYEHLKCCFTIVGIGTTVTIFSHFKDKHLSSLAKLSVCVFFVYATHEIYILNWTKGFFARFMGYTPAGLLISYFVIPIIVVFVCFLFYKLCKKYIPSILGIITGGRI